MTGIEIPAYEALRAARPAYKDMDALKALCSAEAYLLLSAFPSAGRLTPGFTCGYFNTRRVSEALQISDS